MAPDGWEGWVGEGRGAQWSDGAKTLGPTTRGEYAPTQRRMHQRADACAGSKQTAPNMSPRLRRPSARTPRPNMSFNQSPHASIRRGRRPEPPPAIEKQSSTRLPRECKTRPWPCPARNAPRARNVVNIQISAKTNRRQVVSHMMATSANICPLCIPRAASMNSRSHRDTKRKTKRLPTFFDNSRSQTWWTCRMCLIVTPVIFGSTKCVWPQNRGVGGASGRREERIIGRKHAAPQAQGHETDVNTFARCLLQRQVFRRGFAAPPRLRARPWRSTEAHAQTERKATRRQIKATIWSVSRLDTGARGG